MFKVFKETSVDKWSLRSVIIIPLANEHCNLLLMKMLSNKVAHVFDILVGLVMDGNKSSSKL